MRTLRCWARVVAPENVWGAWRDLEAHKRRRADVAAFGLDAEREVLRLADDLAREAWRPGPYRLLRIQDPKRRIIAAAPVRDRVVHHAIHRVIAPWWDRRFIEHSYACLPGRGAHRAVLAFARRARQHRHVILLDIQRYFYSVDRDRLRGLLWRHLPESSLRALLAALLDSGAGLYQRPDVVAWLGWEAPPRPGVGLPIGNLTSQWWGNVVLDALDHHAQRTLRVPAYQRYMDDIAVFGDGPAALDVVREQIGAWLGRERGLVLKDPNVAPLSTYGAIPYLGYVIRPDGITLGSKARGRIPANLRGVIDDPARLGAVVQATAAAWMFGG